MGVIRAWWLTSGWAAAQPDEPLRSSRESSVSPTASPPSPKNFPLPEMATTGTSTVESPVRQSALFRASGTVSAKVKCSRSPVVSSVRLAVGEWHTNSQAVLGGREFVDLDQRAQPGRGQELHTSKVDHDESDGGQLHGATMG